MRKEYSEVSESSRYFLDSVGAPALANGVAELFGVLNDHGRETLSMTMGCYVDIAHRLVHAIAIDGSPTSALYAELRTLRRQAQECLEMGISTSIPTGQFDREVLDSLHFMGGVQKLSGGGGFSFFLIPEMLPLALRLLSVLDGPARRKHLAEIAALRGEALDSTQLRNLDDSVLAKVVAQIATRVRRVVAQDLDWRVSAEDLAAVRVQYLPTATDFYEAGIRYYQRRSWARRRYYIFATTGGVILPQEHFGSDFFRTQLKIPALFDASGKHPIRERYFRVLGGASKLTRLYYFEWERASIEYRKMLTDIEREAPHAGINPEEAISIYKATARDTITSFLRKPRFGLIGVDYFPRQYDYLTLGNGDATLLSYRDKSSTGKIGHGFMLQAKSGAMTEIKRWFAGEALLRDIIPTGTLKDPMTDSFSLLASASLRAFIPIIIGSLRERARRVHVQYAMAMVERLYQTVQNGKAECDVIKMPGWSTAGARDAADQILDRLEKGLPPRSPQSD
jgi:hypothetical protein